MSHLTSTTQKGLFETTVAPRTRSGQGEAMAPSSGSSKPFAVQVDQTQEQARAVNSANFMGYDWPSVQNLPPRTRGKHY